MASFITALEREMSLAAAPPSSADTLYLGGGTPSLLDPGQMETIIAKAGHYFGLTPSAEITVEVNPGTVSLDKLRAYAASGCNRINIGIQSFDDRQLAFLGRIHDTGQALQAFRDARSAGFANIGIDLIFGLPGQTPGMWRKDLRTTLTLRPEHIACYMLSYENGTPLHADLQAGAVTPLSEQGCADLFRLTHNTLGEAGYEHYEISNFAATPQLRSRHNQKYWNHVPYVGLGPSAHSFDLIKRAWNPADLAGYLEQIGQNRSPRCHQEILTREQHVMEAIYLGLRQADGIDPAVFRQRFNLDFAADFRDVLDKWVELEWIDTAGDRYRPSVEGMLFADRMAEELIDIVD
jgi:oxygen-independent coproporphyrinogen-3 oxidase